MKSRRSSPRLRVHTLKCTSRAVNQLITPANNGRQWNDTEKSTSFRFSTTPIDLSRLIPLPVSMAPAQG
jgi:hypothetical protein